MESKVEKKLENILKGLEKEGFKVCEISDIKSHIDFMGTADLLAGRENYSITFDTIGNTNFETTWSNQTITKEWIEKANRILSILEGGF